ncbi:MAG: RNA-binding domain-containing protein, partial [Lacunisphaera sp.]
MIEIQSIAELELLRESVDLECKLALGRDGQGALPEDFWPTYSAFANTSGGVVVLGVREKQQQFVVEGIPNVAKVRKELFDLLNNREKVSANLLTDAQVREVTLDGRTLLVIEIPRANRKHRPVHLSTNPFAGHTYRRLNDGDRPLPDEEVRRMVAEQVEDSRDDRILLGYNFDDLCMETFRAYRQVFANREPGHPWNALEDLDFLRQLGGWRKDRETAESGLTLAGLLMFGWMTTIQEELSNYMLDYQERPEAKIEQRWVDRLTLDGKWSGNLYDFYRKVYLKLTADLKVPFALEQGERKDETPVHVALREALANVLVHADYSDRASVLVVKRPDMFGFRNPGLMRIPAEVAIRGGEHDCRNRTLHKMFRLVGVGEQAGSGIPKIYGGWAKQHWRAPALYERSEPYNQTLLELRMVDLLPKDLLAGLRKVFGAGFDALDQNQRLTLAAAASEKVITHARVREMTGLHPFDATRLLQDLVQQVYLEAHNPGRGAVYCLPGAAIPKPEEVFGGGSEQSESGSAHLPLSSAHLPDSSGGFSEQRDADGCMLSPQLDAPVIDSLDRLKPEFRAKLEGLAIEPR